MPNIQISKIKTRRGTNDQRRITVFDQGEIISTTDTKRVYVGTGTLSGGFVVGNKIHSPLTNYYSLSNVIAEIGDLVFTNNIFYQLTASNYANIGNWANVGTKVNSILFNYDSSNTLTLNPDSLSAIYLDSSTISNGLKIDSGILQVDYHTKSLEISANQLSLKEDGVDEREINSTSFGDGISGGSGEKIGLLVNGDQFYFSGDTLNLSVTSNPITFESLSSSWFGDGLEYNLGLQEIYATLTDVDESTIEKDGNGIISLADGFTPATTELSQVTVDGYGRVTSLSSSIYDIIIGNCSDVTSLSSIFNGSPDGLSGGAITILPALSSDNVTVLELSSAGYIAFEGNISPRHGTTQIGRFAIPIFRY